MIDNLEALKLPDDSYQVRYIIRREGDNATFVIEPFDTLAQTAARLAELGGKGVAVRQVEFLRSKRWVW